MTKARGLHKGSRIVSGQLVLLIELAAAIGPTAQESAANDARLRMMQKVDRLAAFGCYTKRARRPRLWLRPARKVPDALPSSLD